MLDYSISPPHLTYSHCHYFLYTLRVQPLSKIICKIFLGFSLFLKPDNSDLYDRKPLKPTQKIPSLRSL